MTEERAALLITAYADGLRRELTLLGASEVTDLVSEIVGMLRDAAEGDPDVVAAEIERLGPPEELARTILEQHGLKTGPGTPAPSWWRLGVAAPIDILVGLAAPAAGAALAANLLAMTDWSGSDGSPLVRILVALLAVAVIAITGGMAWTYWRPWRDGDRRTTVGMTLAGISVVRVGGARTVALTSDLAAAGLAHARRSRAGSALTLALALALLAWAAVVANTATGFGPPSVDRFVGTTADQERSVRSSIDELYAQVMDPGSNATSSLSAWIGPAGIAGEPFASVVNRMTSPKLRSYSVTAMSTPSPGVWNVTVREQRTTVRTVLVTMGLRVDWRPGNVSPIWMVAGYDER
jgi:hypothetical protein